jgi:extracellular factor (EF) 3-hydroxypalmitic acid methyl ester biosynthesis protein
MNVRASKGRDAAGLENEVAVNLAGPVLPCIDVLFEKFEHIAGRIDAEQVAAHRNYMRRQLHALFLCTPFAHRTFIKPLGYAGDYEMVNMIARNRPEGDSLYAKVVHAWFVRQPPAEAHRNRLKYLVDKLATETLRVMRSGGRARILNLACGPAHEVQEFMASEPIAEHAEFKLVDFNEETLAHVRNGLDQIRHRTGRRTKAIYSRNSVYHLLKEAVRQRAHDGGGPAGEQQDYVYCAGLFDYLTDQVCVQLLGLMYQWLAPGGLLVITNVEPRNPLRQGMEHLLDWHLIYRSAPQLLKLKPEGVAPDDVRVLSDDTGVNVFLEIRKPA